VASDLIFLMGQYEARIPTDRRYATNHMWAFPTDGRLRFGFTAYAVRLLQDVYFLEWSIDAGTRLEYRQEIGNIESKKAESALYAPIAGTLTHFNLDLLKDPSAINVDKYAAGWLFEMVGDDTQLLDASGYVRHLESVWEVTQRTIKGQLNE
jgi:glycine cleavage system H protein